MFSVQGTGVSSRKVNKECLASVFVHRLLEKQPLPLVASC
jgi:hypothetical protein